MQRFFSRNYAWRIQQIDDFSCSPRHSPALSRKDLSSSLLPFHWDAEESFIDEIVNTFDRRMFCRPFGRLSVAIGDHPMCLVSSTHCKKDLNSLAKRSLSLLDYLNVIFLLSYPAAFSFLAHFLVASFRLF